VVGALCLGPQVVLAAQVPSFKGKHVTSWPSLEQSLMRGTQLITLCTGVGGWRYSKERVVVDGNLVTSRGPGTAAEFAFALVTKLCGPDKARELKVGMLFSN
jgi:putative intracellular protease/amidase